MYTLKEAIKDSLVKWGYAKETGCDLNKLLLYIFKEHKTIWGYIGSCGLCHYSTLKIGDPFKRCSICPLAKAGEKCDKDGSLYQQWGLAKTKAVRKKLATKLYNIIKGLNKTNKKKKRS